MNRGTHKRGDTFDYATVITATVGGLPVTNFTGWGGACQLRDATTDALIADLDFSWLDAATGRARLRAQNTRAWPLVLAHTDIELTTPAGDTVSTPTSIITIVKDVTHP
jgi:hypothetical protein